MTCGRSEPDDLPAAGGRRPPSPRPTCATRTRPRALVDATVEHLRPHRRGRQQRRWRTPGGRGHRITSLQRVDRATQPAGTAARRPAGQPPHAAGRRRSDREHRLGLGDPAVAGHRRLRRGEGRTVEPHRPRSRWSGHPRCAWSRWWRDSSRPNRPSCTTATRNRSHGSRPRCRPAAWAPRRTLRRPAAGSAHRWPHYVSGPRCGSTVAENAPRSSTPSTA